MRRRGGFDYGRSPVPIYAYPDSVDAFSYLLTETGLVFCTEDGLLIAWA